MTEPTDELVEQAARAMYEAGNKYGGLAWDAPNNSEIRKDIFRADTRVIIPIVEQAQAARIAELEAQLRLDSERDGSSSVAWLAKRYLAILNRSKTDDAG